MTTEAIIKKHQAYIDQNREQLFKSFAPAFYFHSGESSFPMDPNDYVRDVVMAKYACYKSLFPNLDEIEKKELAAIAKYFITKDEKFNENYTDRMHEPEFQDLLPRSKKEDRDKASNADFLTFNEKKYGYGLGEKVPIRGIHPNNKEGKKAPINVSIIPTKEGFNISYEYFYAVSDAIPGTKWLYNLLPDKWAKKAANFAVHSGDFEGVMINVKIDANGQASINGMQTFAHGRDGARFVEAKDLTYDENGRPSVFVGQQTHPSYADNFVGRNKFVDKVGSKYKLVPEIFVDISPDKEKKKELPKWTCFNRVGDTSCLLYTNSTNAKSYKDLETKAEGWNRYKPSLGLTKAWNKVKGVFKKKHKPIPVSLELKPIEATTRETTASSDMVRSPKFMKELEHKVKKSWSADEKDRKTAAKTGQKSI